jgi:EpsI family protein
VISRILILTVCLTLSAVFVAKASKTEQVPPREPLANLPLKLGAWTGREAEPFDPAILAVLGVDEYANRIYVSQGAAAGLYIGYYESQRQGDTIHSPLNCLPGAGWEPLSKSYLTIPVALGGADGRQESITVNRYVIQKGLDRQVVLYWYQSHGRVVANEYRSKLFMVYDAVRLNRTDAALIRVVSPLHDTGPNAENEASDHAVDLVKAVFPLLDRYLPS